MTRDRDELKTTFDSVARDYHRARPDYPDVLFEALVGAAELREGARVLEIGCGTGKATLPMARRGFQVTAVELGPGLVAEARRRLAPWPDVSVEEGAFETWRPADGRRFDLVHAATAWHWLDPATRYEHAWELLEPGGHLAFWSATHVFPEGGDPFFAEIQEVYDRIGEGVPDGTPRSCLSSICLIWPS